MRFSRDGPHAASSATTRNESQVIWLALRGLPLEWGIMLEDQLSVASSLFSVRAQAFLQPAQAYVG
jgi:hypothetical protein